MAIKQKRSLVTGSIPTTASLAIGELAMNIPDGRIFFRKSGSGSDTVQSVITTGAQNSGSVTLTGSLSIFNSAGNALEISGDVMEFTGSLTITGSAVVTGSLSVTNGITGSLLGTSSFATSASFAVSASWAPGGSSGLSNFISTGSVTASVNVSSTNAFNVVSASNTLIQVTPNRTLLVGDATQIPNETAWKSPGVFGSGSANKVLAGYLASTTNGATIGANNSNFSSWADLNIAGTNLIFRSAETEYMRLTSTGNFGIGVTSPGAKLHVGGAVSASAFTGSLLGTSSFATNADTVDGVHASAFVLNSQTSSFTLTSSFVAYTASINSFSASILSYTSSLNARTSSFATTGSNTFIGNQTITGSVVLSGSAGVELTILGDQVNTGSLTIRSGSVTINTGSLTINSGSIIVNTNGESRVFASTFRPVGSFGQNLYIGHAGTTNTFSAGNDAFGNTSVGVFALDSNTRGYGNTAVGRACLDLVTTGNENTAVGLNAGNGIFDGSNNVAIGSQTFNTHDGWNSVAVGALAGYNINSEFVTGSIYLGYNALASNGALNAVINNEIVIGANTVGLGSNTVVLGNSSIVTTVLRGKVGIGTTAPTVALEISAGSIKAGTNSSTEGTVILQDSYATGNLTNFGTNRSGGGAVISYASIPSPVTTNQFVSTFSSAAARSAIIIQDNISFYTTGSQTIASGSAVIMSERVRITDTGQLAFYRYTSTSSFPGTVAAVLAVDSSGNVITTAASGSAGGGGGGTPGGANTTIQFNDSNTFSGSGAFTFTKATNTVRIQASGSALLVISGSQGELLRVQDSGSSPGTLAVISSGSLNVATFTTSSVIISGSLQVSGSTHGIAEHMILAISDETTNITTGTAKVTFRAPFAMTLTQIPRASLSTASSSGLVTVDINEGGTSILGANKLSIDASERTSTTAATPTTLADTAIADDAEITIDIDAAGTGARGLKVTLYYIKR